MTPLEQIEPPAAPRAAVCIMRLTLEANITQEGGWVEAEICAPPPAGSAPEFRDTVTGTIVLTNTGAALRAEGRLQTQVTLSCSRCTKEHTVPVDIEVSEECTLQDIDQPQAYQETEAGESRIPILNGNQIDLSELVRQLLNLHLPSRSLCKPDCAGLCPHCGQDLNEGSCSCPPEAADPRLAPLHELWSQPEE